MALLRIESLSVGFNETPVLSGVSFSMESGETLAIVGESGSGKSLTALSVIGLAPEASKRHGGVIEWKGVDLAALDERALCKIRGREIGMVFQDPMTSLNPYLTIGSQMTEGLRKHLGLSKPEAERTAADFLSKVGITEPLKRLKQYPHEFSGGMRQRVLIAAALAMKPELLIADEPTTALDVTIQAQILELLSQLRRDLGLALLLITHNFGIAAGIADRVLVMYGGRIMEEAPVGSIFKSPRHPYTRALLDSVPRADADTEKLTVIPGQPPQSGRIPSGCPFHTRCSRAQDICKTDFPLEAPREDGGRLFCHFPLEAFHG